MSYEPTIIIYKPDLDKKQGEILHHQYGKFRKKARTDTAISKQAAWDTLESIIHTPPFKIKGVPMIQVKVELTGRNKAFRKLLDDLDIEYATID